LWARNSATRGKSERDATTDKRWWQLPTRVRVWERTGEVVWWHCDAAREAQFERRRRLRRKKHQQQHDNSRRSGDTVSIE
jgi:hypothetical protein